MEHRSKHGGVHQLMLGAALFLLPSCAMDNYSQSEPLPSASKIEKTTFLSDAGWCWYQDPRVIINNGKLIVGGISGIDGDVKVGVYDLATNTFEGQITLHPELEVDDHDAPVFYVRGDGSLLAMWAKHGREVVHYYAISEPNNYLKWSERKVFEHPFDIPAGNGWGGVTYMNLYNVGSEDKLYNFFRDGPTYNPSFMTSTDGGESWTEETTHFISDEVDGRHRPYARYTQVDAKTVGVTFTDAHPRNYGNSLYYVEFDGDKFENVDGAYVHSIGQGPLKATTADKVYKGTETEEKPEGFGSVPGAAWTVDVEVDEDSHPHIGYSLYNSNMDNRFRLASWSGEEWIDREIAYAGSHLYEREASYTGLFALDPEDPTNLAISTNVDPKSGGTPNDVHEIYYAQVADDASTETIEWTPLTINSDGTNIRPTIVSGEGYKVALWMNGRFTHYEDFDTNIVGTILERPKAIKD